MRVKTRHVVNGLLGVTAAAALSAGYGVLAESAAQNASPAVPLSKEWPTYGHDSASMRFSPLTEITPANAGQLKVAWVYHMKPPAAPAPAVATGGPTAPGAPE